MGIEGFNLDFVKGVTEVVALARESTKSGKRSVFKGGRRWEKNTGPHGVWMQGANLLLGQCICIRKDK